MKRLKAALALVSMYIGSRLVRLGCKLAHLDVRETLTQVLSSPPPPPFDPDYDLIGYLEEPERGA